MRRALFILSLCAMLVACGKSDLVIGKWQRVDNPSWIEFSEDGRVVLFDGQGSTSGAWKRLDDGRIQVDVSAVGRNVSAVFQTTIQGDNAIFTSPEGKSLVYRRARGTGPGREAVAR